MSAGLSAKTAGTHAGQRGILPALLLILGAALAIMAGVGDSLTYDENTHLTSGMSYLRTGDFRLAPETPPLSKVWAALPILLLGTQWPPTEMEDWHRGVVWNVGKAWLFRLNRGEGFLLLARLMIVVTYLALSLVIWRVATDLFGSSSGLLALGLAILNPIYLAHGHLVSTDIPLGLVTFFAVVSCAWVLERVTLWRALLFGLSVAACSLTKFNWPVIIPAILSMMLFSVVRQRPISIDTRLAGGHAPNRWMESRVGRTAVVASLGFLSVVITVVAIWTSYGWRFSPFHTSDAATAVMPGAPNAGEPAPLTMPEVWGSVTKDYEGKPMKGGVGAILWARDRRLLPEAYLYGLAYTFKTTALRASYLNGKFHPRGSPAYFPETFALKTPIPTMVFMLLGLLALVAGRARPRNSLLLVGVCAFVVTYAFSSLTSRINIGHRHLLPIYGPLLALAGGATTWADRRWLRTIGVALLLWLTASVGFNHPHYLSYFNEFIGGPRNGYRYLADSNIDWGQDIKRLRSYAQRHPSETIKLAYFGSGEPNRYGFECEMLPSNIPFREPCRLSAGTYVISVTQLLGVYDQRVRDDYWSDGARAAEMRTLVTEADEAASAGRTDAAELATKLDTLRRRRLLYELRHRQEDERVGRSLFVYRLSQTDVDSLCSP